MPIRRKFIDANRYPTHKFFVPTNIYDIIVMTDQNSVTSEEPRVVLVRLLLNRPNILFNQDGIEACVSV